MLVWWNRFYLETLRLLQITLSLVGLVPGEWELSTSPQTDPTASHSK